MCVFVGVFVSVVFVAVVVGMGLVVVEMVVFILCVVLEWNGDDRGV